MGMVGLSLLIGNCNDDDSVVSMRTILGQVSSESTVVVAVGGVDSGVSISPEGAETHENTPPPRPMDRKFLEYAC